MVNGKLAGAKKQKLKGKKCIFLWYKIEGGLCSHTKTYHFSITFVDTNYLK